MGLAGLSRTTDPFVDEGIRETSTSSMGATFGHPTLRADGVEQRRISGPANLKSTSASATRNAGCSRLPVSYFERCKVALKGSGLSASHSSLEAPTRRLAQPQLARALRRRRSATVARRPG